MLKIYEWERDTYPEFILVSLMPCQAETILRKLVRHFKTPPVRLTFRGYGFIGGAYNYQWQRIGLGKLTSLSSVCHEFAHHLANTRWGGQQGHNKKFKRELKKVYTYAKRWLPEKQPPQIEYELTSKPSPTIESADLNVKGEKK